MRRLAPLLYPLAERYLKRDIRPKLRELRNFRTLSPQERRRQAHEQLVKTLEWSGVQVPYYRDLFQTLQFSAEKVRKSPEALQELPYLTKDILREQSWRMYSDTHREQKLHLRKTNGSTGISTEIVYDQESLDWTAACNLLTYDFTQRKLSQTEIHLSTAFLDGIPRKAQWIEDMKCLAMGRVNLHTQNFDEAGLKKLMQQIEAAKPFLIQGHPSTLYFLSLYVRKHGLSKYPLVHAFESTGETLEPEKARLIEDTLGCKTYNRYGNAEFGVVAHSKEDLEWLEVFDFNVWPENKVHSDGRKEIILTGLLNPAMPLIRYETGDLGELRERNGLPHLYQIYGRVHDVIPIQGKMHPTHFMKDLLERWGGVDEWQVVLRDAGPHLLKIVGNAALNQAHIREQSQIRFGNEYEVEFVSLGDLQMTGWRDKFRYVVKQSPR